MHRILQILIDDFKNRKLSAEYQLIQHKVSEVENPFMGSLSKELCKEYLKLEALQNELHSQAFDEFALYVFENLKKFF